MTYHKVRAKKAKGHRPNAKSLKHKSSPRVAVSFPPLIFKAINFLADKWDVPFAEVVRIGMTGYTTPMLYDLAAGREPNFKAGKSDLQP